MTLPGFGSSSGSWLRRIARHALAPGLLYLVAFGFIGYSLLGKFFTEFWGDRMDGLQNAWNLWWINLVLHRPDLHPSIWYTSLLHWPFGTTLVGHTLAPFNGYLGAILLNFLALRTAFNTVIVFAFVMTGVTTYWLAYHLTRSYVSSLIAGFMFAFSAYSVMHLAAGQLNVVSLEWMPLFLLCWYVLVTRPGIPIAIAAAVSLWLVSLCDYYFLMYGVAVAIFLVVWQGLIGKDAFFLIRREYRLPVAAFLVVALGLVGPLIAQIVLANSRDPFTGAHDPLAYSLDLLAPVIPGRAWLFGSWTRFYWSRLTESAKEGEGYLPLSAFVFMGLLWLWRKRLEVSARQQMYLWLAVLGFFFLLALGPALHVAGKVVWSGAMPYDLLVRALPFVGLSGIPARMSVMILLSACILSAFALRELLARFPSQRLLTFGLLGLLVLQMLPAPIETTSVIVPDYIKALANYSDDGGVINLIGTNPSVWLYYQTTHGKPITFGYISRVPASVAAGDAEVQAAIEARDFDRLWSTYHVRYIIAAATEPVSADPANLAIRLLYDAKGTRIYELGCPCSTQP